MALTTAQTATAALLALGVGVSGFLDWVDGRSVRGFPARDLFTGVNDRHSSSLTSLAAVLVVAAVAALACSLTRSRAFTIAVAGVILAIDVLWATLEAVHRAPSDFVAAGIGPGAWVSFGCALALIVTASLRRSSRPDR
jgi:hypothetical protein